VLLLWRKWPEWIPYFKKLLNNLTLLINTEAILQAVDKQVKLLMWMLSYLRHQSEIWLVPGYKTSTTEVRAGGSQDQQYDYMMNKLGTTLFVEAKVVICVILSLSYKLLSLVFCQDQPPWPVSPLCILRWIIIIPVPSFPKQDNTRFPSERIIRMSACMVYILGMYLIIPMECFWSTAERPFNPHKKQKIIKK